VNQLHLAMDYKKWDAFDEMEEEEKEEKEEESLTRLLQIKQTADELFSLSKYEQSLSLYHKITTQLKSFTRDTLASIDLFVLCQLNISCCYMKIHEWGLCITACDDMLSSPHTYNAEKRTRGLYFKAYSLVERYKTRRNGGRSATENGHAELDADMLTEALVCCVDIQQIVDTTDHFADKSLVCQVQPLVARINQLTKPINGTKSHCTSSSSAIAATSSISPSLPPSSLTQAALTITPSTTSIHHDTSPCLDIPTLTLTDQATHLLSKNQPLAAIKLYHRCLQLLQEEGDDIQPPAVTCYDGLGDCYCRLKEYDEVSVNVCLYVDEDVMVIMLYLLLWL
jgi:tetratricopeptide (TPR) repeat protein